MDKEKPLTLTIGQESIFPHLEQNLIDMEIGQTKEIILTPDQAYGQYNEQLVLSAPCDKFGPDFSEKHVRTILKNLGLKFAKPYPKDYRRPPDAEKQLKKT